MRIRSFVLCDSAVTRDQLLTIVNGGFNELVREDYPATMQCELAISIEFDLTREYQKSQLSLEMQTEVGEKFALDPLQMNVELRARDDEELPAGSVPAIWHQTIDLRNMVVPGPGYYRIILKADGEILTYTRFEARQVS